jgi:hypothetical protein
MDTVVAAAQISLAVMQFSVAGALAGAVAIAVWKDHRHEYHRR